MNRKKQLELRNYSELHDWSIERSDEFWDLIWDYCEVIGEKGGRRWVDPEKMPGAQFFPDATLNFAENLLRRRDDTDALVFWGEDRVKARLSWNQLYDSVSMLAQALRERGVGPGDRVAAILPNIPEAVIAMLAVASIGAVWSSCSPDFGEQGVLDRFKQIEPKLLFAVDGYFYNGKAFDILPKLSEIVRNLPTLETAVVVPYMSENVDRPASVDAIDRAILYGEFIEGYHVKQIDFNRTPFNHPLYILFSSGTTGVPKCIVHGVGGTLIQHLKEMQLHCDILPGDRVFYFTTCTWMMWNWLVSALASEATLLLYDGSPFYPDGNVLFDFADAEQMTLFGTSAKFIDTLKKRGVRPSETHDLSSIKMMASTGSPLVAESFDFVYRNIKEDLYLASISGGTDIVSCFALGNPTSPLYRGEIACRGLGMAVEVWNDEGKSVVGEKGELVCIKPFPSMPVGFWNDPDDRLYREAYFERFGEIWAQGDFAEITENDGVVIYGRSDATLNPGGVRIGTAEIYRQVEQLDEVLESLVIGQIWDGDTRVVLFVVLRDEGVLSDALVESIRQVIRRGASPRHTPAKVIAVSDIPRTKSGKIAELAVRDVVEGKEIKNRDALANPECLEQYRNIEVLNTD